MPGSSRNQSFEAAAFEDNAVRLVKLQDQYTARWHEHPAAAPKSLSGFKKAVVAEHLTNFRIWHAEDSVRRPGEADREIARIKRLIDETNQLRNDLAERCDGMLLSWLAARRLPVEDAELHSETPGLMIDRLSILSLKLFHTGREAERDDASPEHRAFSRERWRVLSEQRSDLAAALSRLWSGVLAGEKRFKLYRQMKMYNDPKLNPAIYQSASGS